MPTIRLYRAVKAHLDASAIMDAAAIIHGIPPLELIGKENAAKRELEAAMEEAKPIVEGNPRERAVAIRIAGEQDIARFMVRSLIEQGHEVCLEDEEEDIQYVWTSDSEDMFAHMFDMDMAYVSVRGPGIDDIGTIQLVYGNSPEEMISDYHIKLEKLLKPTFQYIHDYYDNTYIVES